MPNTWYECSGCDAIAPDDGFQPEGWAHTMDGRNLCPDCRTDV
jgi:hypothetical protein